MHCRGVTDAEFERVAAELADAQAQGDEVELITSQHEDHGAVILIRDASRCMILVAEPSHLDRVQTRSAAASDGAIVERAIRARAR